MPQADIYPDAPSCAETPWGLEAIYRGEPVVKVSTRAQFIRLCHRIVQQKQYTLVTYEEYWPNPVMLDLFSANVVAQVWCSVSLRNKKKLLRILRKHGPNHLIRVCFSAVS